MYVHIVGVKWDVGSSNNPITFFVLTLLIKNFLIYNLQNNNNNNNNQFYKLIINKIMHALHFKN